MPEFDCTAPLTLSITVLSGDVEITAEERTTASVEVTPYDRSDKSRETAERTVVEMHGDTLVVRVPDDEGRFWRRYGRIRVTARVPRGTTTLNVKSASADVKATGEYAAGQISTASGDARVEHVAGDFTATAASGDVRIDHVGGDLSIRSASGDLAAGVVSGDLSAQTASGDMRFGEARSSVRASTASGDINVGRTSNGTVSVKSASGDVTLGVVAGTRAWLDLSTLSGSTSNDLSMSGGEEPTGEGTQLRLHIRTLSGDISIRRVTPAQTDAA
jgi:DUF4097 and DUF4098 domain-containing protein YvlB